MRSCSLLVAVLTLALPVFIPGPAILAVPFQGKHVQAELIAEATSLASGGAPGWVAVALRPEPGWHVYWINPGDSGLATSLVWSLPPGVEAGPIEWAHPHAFTADGSTNYGYSEEVLHLVPITVAAGWPADRPVPLSVEAKWLACADVCIPGKADLRLELPLAAHPAPDAARAASFARARTALPREEPGWKARFAAADGVFTLEVSGAKDAGAAERVEFFPAVGELVDHAAPQKVELGKDGTLRLRQPLSPYFVSAPAELQGVLVLHRRGGAQAVKIHAVSR